mgnify:FL=1
MICPSCGYEYKEGVKICPDCGAALEESAGVKTAGQKEVTAADKNDLISAGIFDDLAEFEVLKKYLEEDNIFYHAVEHNPSKESMRGHAHLSRFPVAYELFIEEKKYEEAKKLVEEIRQAAVDASDIRWQEPQPDIETAELCQAETDLEASVIRDVLLQEGIYSFARNNVLPFTNVIMSFFNRKGKVTIIVNKEDLEKASKIIKEMK